MHTRNYLATSNLILSFTFSDHFMCVLASLLCTQTSSHSSSAHIHIHIHALEPIMCTHQLKENPGDDVGIPW